MTTLATIIVAITVFSNANVPVDLDLLTLPEHLAHDREAQLLLEYRKDRIVKRYEIYGDTRHQGGVPPRTAPGIPISTEVLSEVLAIGRRELKKAEVDFFKLNLVLGCLGNRTRKREIVAFVLEVMQTPFTVHENEQELHVPGVEAVTISATLGILAWQNTREARKALHACAMIVANPEGCKYFRTKDNGVLPPSTLEHIAKNAIGRYFVYAPERQAIRFVRRVVKEYEEADLDHFLWLSAAKIRAEALADGEDLARQPPPAP